MSRAILFEGVLNDDYIRRTASGGFILHWFEFRNEWSNFERRECFPTLAAALDYYAEHFSERLKAQAQYLGEKEGAILQAAEEILAGGEE